MFSDLKHWRIATGKSMEAAAAAAGVTAAMWSRWESGRRRVPAERVLELEQLTTVSRHLLRPDVFGPLSTDAQCAETSAMEAAE